MDTINFLIERIAELECNLEMKSAEEHELRWEIAKISSGIIIALFILERFINFFLSRNTLKKTWYLEVLIKPNLGEINVFYQELEAKTSDAIDDILSLKDQDLEGFKSKKDRELDKFKLLKLDFDHKFISLVRSYSQKKAIELTKILNELEDSFSEVFSSTDLNYSHKESLKKNISANRSLFYEKLTNFKIL